jgi:hypothetical protein
LRISTLCPEEAVEDFQFQPAFDDLFGRGFKWRVDFENECPIILDVVNFVHQVLMQTNYLTEFRGLFKERVNAKRGLFIRRRLLPLLHFAASFTLEIPLFQAAGVPDVGAR